MHAESQSEARDTERQAEQRALAQAKAAQAAEESTLAALTRVEVAKRDQTALADELRAAKAVAAQARADAERFQQMPGLQGRIILWLAR